MKDHGKKVHPLLSAAIYSRKSVYSDKSESTENQILLCRKYLEERLPRAEVRIYEDNGFSAKNTDRPQFQKMLHDIAEGKISTVICYRLDRISRSVSDFAKLIELFAGCGVEFICVREQFDTVTPMGKAMMYISSIFAQLERETIAERVRDNMLQLARGGARMGGRAPRGYRSGTDESSLIPHEAEAEWVRSCFREFLKSGSLKETAENMGNITPFGLRKLLKNPVYCPVTKETVEYMKRKGYDVSVSEEKETEERGFLPYNRTGKGERILAAGEHMPLVSWREFLLTQAFLDIVPIKNNYALLSGILTCGACGKKMSAQRDLRGDHRYRCTECGCSICGKKADRAAEELLAKCGIGAKNMTERRIYVRILIQSAEWNGTQLIFRVNDCNKTISGNDRCRVPENW